LERKRFRTEVRGGDSGCDGDVRGWERPGQRGWRGGPVAEEVAASTEVGRAGEDSARWMRRGGRLLRGARCTQRGRGERQFYRLVGQSGELSSEFLKIVKLFEGPIFKN
jgi:hypothetical protein